MQPSESFCVLTRKKRLVDYGTDLVNPNFAQLAESAGIFGVRIEKPEDLRSGLLRAFEQDGPALVEVLVNRQELSMPPRSLRSKRSDSVFTWFVP